MPPPDARDETGLQLAHARFQTWFAWTFLLAAGAVALWMFFGPHPEDDLLRVGALFFVELPLFVVLALIGMNALVRKGMGRRRKKMQT